MERKDPKGYYAILQVAPHASAARIKSAYRHRAMELHPDRNKSLSATAKFQLLQLAYDVLSDSNKRATYDTQAAVIRPTPAGKAANSGAAASHEPIPCSVCAQITAQPRYAVYWEIKSFLLVTRRSPIQGIYCPTCAEKKSLRATGITWLLGWWSLPSGPFYSLHAILSNLIGGERPALINAQLLAYQGSSFDLRGNANIAVNITREALKFAKKIPKSEPLRDSLINSLQDACKTAPNNVPTLVNGWSLFRRPFYVQAGIIAIALIVLTIAGITAIAPSPNVREPQQIRLAITK